MESATFFAELGACYGPPQDSPKGGAARIAYGPHRSSARGRRNQTVGITEKEEAKGIKKHLSLNLSV